MSTDEGIEQTSASLLTPPGTGAIAVVALGGPLALPVLKEVFRPHGGWPTALRPNKLLFGRIFDAQGDIDDVLIATAAVEDPCSFEINTHGSWRVAQRLLTRFTELGVTVSPPDQRPACDPCSGADALDRDLFVALSQCKTTEAIKTVTASAAAFRVWLSDTPAGGEKMDLAAVRDALERALNGYEQIRVWIDGVRVVLIGPPNAGKSTLANRLFARRSSLESPEPGTTRDWVEESAVLGGVPIRLVDTAGLRESAQPLESEAVRRSMRQAAQADVTWIVLDGAASLPMEAGALLADKADDRRALLLVNKMDKLGKSARAWLPPGGWGRKAVLLSARTGEGMKQLEDRFKELLNLRPINCSLPGLICHRQAEVVRLALARWTGNSSDVWADLRTDLAGLASIE